jgi:ubiquinone/menaquinone biosynthesis C-methylase UbiE
MKSESDRNPTGRFSGLADIYAKSRPSYPDEASDFIVAHCGLKPGDTMLDVGCGTGISTRLFAQRNLQLIGIEPNDNMRLKAEGDHSSFTYLPVYLKATAEQTGLNPNSVNIVLCAQAFHWFNQEVCLSEFKRILKTPGYVALMWNERDEADPFTKAYGDVLRKWSETKSVEVPRRQAGQALLQSELFADKKRYNFYNEQVVDEAGMLGRAFSASYAPREGAERQKAETALKEVFAQFADNGQVTFHYETSLYLGSKKNVEKAD